MSEQIVSREVERLDTHLPLEEAIEITLKELYFTDEVTTRLRGDSEVSYDNPFVTSRNERSLKV